MRPRATKIINEGDYFGFWDEIAPHGGFIARNLCERHASGCNASGRLGLRINLVLHARDGGTFARDGGIPESVTDQSTHTQGEHDERVDEMRFHGASVTVMVNAISASFAYAETGRAAEVANGVSWSAS